MEVLAFVLLVAVVYAFGELWFVRLFGENGLPAGQWLIVLSGFLSAAVSQLGGIDWLIGLFIGLAAGLVIICAVTRWLQPLRPPKIWRPAGFVHSVDSSGDLVFVRYVFEVPYQLVDEFRRQYARGRYRLPGVMCNLVDTSGKTVMRRAFKPRPQVGPKFRLI